MMNDEFLAMMNLSEINDTPQRRAIFMDMALTWRESWSIVTMEGGTTKQYGFISS